MSGITIGGVTSSFNAEANNLANGGTYLVETMVARKDASKSGTPRLVLKLRVALGSSENVVLFEDIYLTEPHKKEDGTMSRGGLWKLEQYCEAVGFTGDLAVDDPMALMETFVGKKCLIDARTESWTNAEGVTKDRTRVGKFYALDGDSSDVAKSVSNGTPASIPSTDNSAGGEEIPF